MKKKSLQTAVYPLIFVNLALGLLMFFSTYRFILVVVEVLLGSGTAASEWLGPFIFVQQTASICGAIILGVAALILFPVLESYYQRHADKGWQLFFRFIWVLGLQLLYLGSLSLLSILLVGQLFAVNASLFTSLGLLILGGGLTIYGKSRLNDKENNDLANGMIEES